MAKPLIVSILREFTRSISSMILKGYISYKQLIYSMLDKTTNINKWRKDFIIEVFMLFLSIKGRINFFQLERYGQFCEQRYRQQFEKPFLDSSYKCNKSIQRSKKYFRRSLEV